MEWLAQPIDILSYQEIGLSLTTTRYKYEEDFEGWTVREGRAIGSPSLGNALIVERGKGNDYLFIKYSWIELPAFLPAPMARMTVAEPVTISPPAQTPGLLVFPVSRSATI